MIARRRLFCVMPGQVRGQRTVVTVDRATLHRLIEDHRIGMFHITRIESIPPAQEPGHARHDSAVPAA